MTEPESGFTETETVFTQHTMTSAETRGRERYRRGSTPPKYDGVSSRSRSRSWHSNDYDRSPSRTYSSHSQQSHSDSSSRYSQFSKTEDFTETVRHGGGGADPTDRSYTMSHTRSNSVSSAHSFRTDGSDNEPARGPRALPSHQDSNADFDAPLTRPHRKKTIDEGQNHNVGANDIPDELPSEEDSIDTLSSYTRSDRSFSTESNSRTPSLTDEDTRSFRSYESEDDPDEYNERAELGPTSSNLENGSQIPRTGSDQIYYPAVVIREHFPNSSILLPQLHLVKDEEVVVTDLNYQPGSAPVNEVLYFGKKKNGQQGCFLSSAVFLKTAESQPESLQPSIRATRTTKGSNKSRAATPAPLGPYKESTVCNCCSKKFRGLLSSSKRVFCQKCRNSVCEKCSTTTFQSIIFSWKKGHRGCRFCLNQLMRQYEEVKVQIVSSTQRSKLDKEIVALSSALRSIPNEQ